MLRGKEVTMKFITDEKAVSEKDKDKAPTETETIFANGGNNEHTALQT